MRLKKIEHRNFDAACKELLRKLLKIPIFFHGPMGLGKLDYYFVLF
jgi:hypothetical protein